MIELRGNASCSRIIALQTHKGKHAHKGKGCKSSEGGGGDLGDLGDLEMNGESAQDNREPEAPQEGVYQEANQDIKR